MAEQVVFLINEKVMIKYTDKPNTPESSSILHDPIEMTRFIFKKYLSGEINMSGEKEFRSLHRLDNAKATMLYQGPSVLDLLKFAKDTKESDDKVPDELAEDFAPKKKRKFHHETPHTESSSSSSSSDSSSSDTEKEPLKLSKGGWTDDEVKTMLQIMNEKKDSIGPYKEIRTINDLYKFVATELKKRFNSTKTVQQIKTKWLFEKDKEIDCESGLPKKNLRKDKKKKKKTPSKFDVLTAALLEKYSDLKKDRAHREKKRKIERRERDQMLFSMLEQLLNKKNET